MPVAKIGIAIGGPWSFFKECSLAIASSLEWNVSAGYLNSCPLVIQVQEHSLFRLSYAEFRANAAQQLLARAVGVPRSRHECRLATRSRVDADMSRLTFTIRNGRIRLAFKWPTRQISIQIWQNIRTNIVLKTLSSNDWNDLAGNFWISTSSLSPFRLARQAAQSEWWETRDAMIFLRKIPNISQFGAGLSSFEFEGWIRHFHAKGKLNSTQQSPMLEGHSRQCGSEISTFTIALTNPKVIFVFFS